MSAASLLSVASSVAAPGATAAVTAASNDDAATFGGLVDKATDDAGPVETAKADADRPETAATDEAGATTVAVSAPTPVLITLPSEPTVSEGAMEATITTPVVAETGFSTLVTNAKPGASTPATAEAAETASIPQPAAKTEAEAAAQAAVDVTQDAQPAPPARPATPPSAALPPPPPAPPPSAGDAAPSDKGRSTKADGAKPAGRLQADAPTAPPPTASVPALAPKEADGQSAPSFADAAVALAAESAPVGPDAPPDVPPAAPPPAVAATVENQAAARNLSLSTMSHAAVEATTQIAAQITRRLDAKNTRFEMALSPDDLGRVDVSLDIGADGRLAARLAFDNPAAAMDMRGRVDELRRQLEEAGFQLADNAFQFAERDRSSGDGFDRRQGRAFADAGRVSDDADAVVAPARWSSLSLTPERVDMKV